MWSVRELEESETVAVKVTVPLAVGVPERRPVAGARLNPLGRLPLVMDQVYGCGSSGCVERGVVGSVRCSAVQRGRCDRER